MESKKSSLLIINSINFLLCLFPIAFILGNFIINLIIVFTSILGIFLYKREVFKIKNDIPTLLFFLFFITIILSTFLNSLRENNYENIFKSILYLRYFIFLLVIRCLIINQNLNFKYLLSSFLFLSILASADVVFQYFYGKDFFGFHKSVVHSSGFFGKEFVTGAFIQRFGFLGFFLIPFLIQKNQKNLFYISVFIFFVYFMGIFLSGNRVPVILSVIYLFLVLIFVKEIRQATIVSMVLCLLTFSFVLHQDKNMRSWYFSFYENAISIVPKAIGELKRNYSELENEKNKKKFVEKQSEQKFEVFKSKPDKQYKILPFGSGHGIIYITAIDTWKDKPVLGGGIKSFRKNCVKKLHLPNRVCENHPHHYYLDILNDVGLVGLFFLMLSLCILIIQKLKIYRKKINKYSMIFWGFFFAVILEFFPLRSSGGFFSTWNAAYIFFIISVSLSEYKRVTYK